MSLKNYWPSKVHIAQCIRTEAEELAEVTLLAVHEPMRLLKKETTGDKYVTEHDLLDHLLKIDRPIPIIGRSGVGKSHLIRWLSTQLKLREESKDWHVVRIPKNASLREVLDLLLMGLKGEVFEQARSQINNIGQELDTKEVAQHLLVFMGHQLNKKYLEAKKELDGFKSSKIMPSEADKTRLKKIMLHASEESGLKALINDVDFQINLLKPSHCIYQFASRLTKGATDDELSKNDYQIHADDLDFSINLQNLALSARKYVQQAQLNTSLSAREDAVSVLNEVLGDATREAFQHLFQFNGGSFLELFKDIRRHLKDRTLVVLVEDMAAISAIEDVLIDSLIDQQIKDGEETLCPLRSAIAVTDGYAGYVRRKATIGTRARAEWWIEERVGDEEETTERIIDFCSRYLNAARYGYDSLYSLYSLKRNPEEDSWPPVWRDKDDESEDLDAFQIAPGTGVPLFPFNKAAISALSDRFCRDSVTRELQFNPREVLNNILLSVLRDGRDYYEKNHFPPAGLAEIKAIGTLRTDLSTLGLVDTNRAETLAAIWGFGARNLVELKGKLSADIAAIFNIPDFASYLITGVIKPVVKVSTDTKDTKDTKDTIIVTDPDMLALDNLRKTVDLWFEKTELDQLNARVLRAGLDGMYQLYARNEWAGIRDLPSLKISTRPIIYLPYAAGNTTNHDICFCSDAAFSSNKESLELYAVALAIFRYDYYKSKDQNIGWTYPDGFDDFTRYQNFASSWVPATLQSKTVEVRSQLNEKLSRHIQSAWALGIFRDSDKHIDCINKLLMNSDKIRSQLPNALSNSVKIVWEEHLNKWDNLRKDWLSLIASNDHGMQGDLAVNAFSAALKNQPDRNLFRFKEIVSNDMKPTSQLFGLLSNCDNFDAFNTVLTELIALIQVLQKTGNYPTIDELPTAKTLVNKIQKLTSEAAPWLNVKNYMSLFETDDAVRDFQLINQIDGQIIQALYTILNSWKIVYRNQLPILTNANNAWGAGQLIESKQLIENILIKISTDISELGVNNEHP